MGSDIPLKVGVFGAELAAGAVNSRATLGIICAGAAAGRLNAAGAVEFVVMAVSEGALLVAVAVAVTSWLGAVIGWTGIDRGGRRGGRRAGRPRRRNPCAARRS